MTADELKTEIARCALVEKEMHARLIALRACLRARQRLDQQIAEAGERAKALAGKPS